MFVPLHGCWSKCRRAAFAASWQAFVLNTLPRLPMPRPRWCCSLSAPRDGGWGSCSPSPMCPIELCRMEDIFGIRDAPFA